MKFIIQRTSDDALGFENPGLKEELHADGRKYWTIELMSLEELRDLFFEQGEVVLTENYYNSNQDITGVLEIYDDYRE